MNKGAPQHFRSRVSFMLYSLLCHLTYLIKLSRAPARFFFHTCLFLFPSIPPSLNYKQGIQITDKDCYNFLYTGEFLLTGQTQKVVFKVITNTCTRMQTPTHAKREFFLFSFLCLSDKTIPSGQIFSSGRNSMQIGLESHSSTHNHNKSHTRTCFLPHRSDIM